MLVGLDEVNNGRFFKEEKREINVKLDWTFIRWETE
jgi:hypothetical protein